MNQECRGIFTRCHNQYTRVFVDFIQVRGGKFLEKNGLRHAVAVYDEPLPFVTTRNPFWWVTLQVAEADFSQWER